MKLIHLIRPCSYHKPNPWSVRTYRYTHPGNLTPTNPPTLLWCAHFPAQNRTCAPRQGIPNLLVKHTLLQGCLFQHSAKFSLARSPLEDCLTASENWTPRNPWVVFPWIKNAKVVTNFLKILSSDRRETMCEWEMREGKKGEKGRERYYFVLFLHFRRFQGLKLWSPVPTSYVTFKEMNFEVTLILFFRWPQFCIISSVMVGPPQKNRLKKKKTFH